MEHKPIFLIGFMGCGKSTSGKRLAQLTNYQFIDLDILLEQTLGKSIEEIFNTEGEAGFRARESDLLRQHPFPSNAVVACGGGLPCFHDNMKYINQLGISFYLKGSPKELASRLYHGKKNRPLIKDLNDTELIHFIENKLKEREIFYQQAQITVEALNFDAKNVFNLYKQAIYL